MIDLPHSSLILCFSLLLCEKRYSKNLCKKAAIKKTINWFSRPVIAYCRSKVLQNAAILCPSLSYHLSLRSLFCLFLSGRFTQVLLYIQTVCMSCI